MEALTLLERADFNSRSCEGATLCWPHITQKHIISTHAPVKERRRASASPPPRRYFNSRSCEGATCLRRPLNPPQKFQLTLL